MVKQVIKVSKEIKNFIKNKTFTGCGLGFFCCGESGVLKKRFFEGVVREEKKSKPVGETTFFDLASLTKPLVTLPSVLALLKSGKISLDEGIEDLLGEKVSSDMRHICLSHLLSHRAGLPPHRHYYRWLRSVDENKRMESLIKAIVSEDTITPLGRYIYSDLDYMLLGAIVERKSGENLFAFWRKRILYPWKLEKYFFDFGDKEGRKERFFLETGLCPWSGNILQGLVNDDNCRAMGKMMGHAGLFGTLYGVLEFLEGLLHLLRNEVDHPFLSNSDLRDMTEGGDSLHWAQGFDVPTGENPCCGHHFSKKTIGHLGYTGTSIWLDMVMQRGVVLLSNRVLLDPDGVRIREARPHLHDVAMEFCDENSNFSSQNS